MNDRLSFLDQAVERLRRIDYGNFTGDRSEVIPLMDEFFRRMQLWGKKLEGDRFTRGYFDVAERIAPEIRLSQEEVEALGQDISKAGRTARLILSWYLQWINLKDAHVQDQGILPDPYEPFICVLEMGCLPINQWCGFYKLKSLMLILKGSAKGLSLCHKATQTLNMAVV
ncbi:MAG: hypothetical protein KME04_17015 [Pleurocapsa minor GSE-CHR-MK-17-07R]|jgi:hypothetical protein|nr:hypothetical protein [Pleurocapsa minor GSE-CHR-MK 17-07R]